MSATRAHLGVRIGLAAFAAAAGLAVSGCADLARVTAITPEPIDTSSPVVGQVRRASAASYRTPSFRDVPPKPTDAPPPATFRAAVAENAKAHDKLEAWVAANPPMIPLDPSQTEAFAADQRARIPAGQAEDTAPVGTEEYAARLRALATPPPPPK
jgi:hypothetical protein